MRGRVDEAERRKGGGGWRAEEIGIRVGLGGGEAGSYLVFVVEWNGKVEQEVAVSPMHSSIAMSRITDKRRRLPS